MKEKYAPKLQCTLDQLRGKWLSSVAVDTPHWRKLLGRKTYIQSQNQVSTNICNRSIEVIYKYISIRQQF